MSPIAVAKGFTERYIRDPDKKSITRQIKDSYRRISEGHKLVVIEGTGHAGVGSVFDHSNARVAHLLKSKVILISSGGIGRPIDEILLNRALFEKEGVKVLGVIINKVLPGKFDKINRLVRLGLERKGVDVLGVIPYNPILSNPTLEQILEETDYKAISGEAFLENSIERVIVGAMEPEDAIDYIIEGSLLITPGDRSDMIRAALKTFRAKDKNKLKISGIVLSGGQTPDKSTMNLLNKANIPVLIAADDTYRVASTIHDLTVKIRPRDINKIDLTVSLIKEYVDLDRIAGAI